VPLEDRDYTVRVWFKEKGAPTPWSHYVTSCTSLMRAMHLAKNVRQIFGCSTWIEDFDRPASLPQLKVRATIQKGS